MVGEAKTSHLKAKVLHATEICGFSAQEPRVSKKCIKSDAAKQVHTPCDASKGVCTSAGKQFRDPQTAMG